MNGTLNDFLRKFGTFGSRERTAVSGRPFCAIFSFYQLEWRLPKVEVTLFLLLPRVFIPVSNGTKLSQAIMNYDSYSQNKVEHFS